MTMTTGHDLEPQYDLVDVRSGEVLPATTANAHRALTAAREMKARIQDVIREVEAYLVEESRRQGTKTFHTPEGDLVLVGGPSTEYDAETLEQLLREAGCPEERIRETVKEEVVTTYKVDRSVLRQLTGSNPDYAAAAELAQRELVKPYRVSAK